MSKFLLKKRFSLDFLGDEWKEKKAYIEFNSLTVGDISTRLPNLAQIDENDPKSVEAGMRETMELLKEKFISGKGVSKDNELIDITKEGLEELPIEVITRAVNFLSQGLVAPIPEPSETSSPPKAQ